jgi:hypothetical protein
LVNILIFKNSLNYYIKNLQIHSVLYSFLPFTMLAIANVLLIVFLFKLSRSLAVARTSTRTITIAATTHTMQLNVRSRAQKQKSLNLTVISLTLIFILMTSPSAVCSIFFESWIKSYTGTLVISLSDSICFSYHGLNFLLLLLTNKKFTMHVFKLIRCERDGDGVATMRLQIQHQHYCYKRNLQSRSVLRE